MLDEQASTEVLRGRDHVYSSALNVQKMTGALYVVFREGFEPKSVKTLAHEEFSYNVNFSCS